MDYQQPLNLEGGPNNGAVPTLEPWMTKRQIAMHFNFTTRWVERRMAQGMPSATFGRSRRFKLTDVERWLTATQEAGT